MASGCLLVLHTRYSETTLTLKCLPQNMFSPKNVFSLKSDSHQKNMFYQCFHLKTGFDQRTCFHQKCVLTKKRVFTKRGKYSNSCLSFMKPGSQIATFPLLHHTSHYTEPGIVCNLICLNQPVMANTQIAISQENNHKIILKCIMGPCRRRH